MRALVPALLILVGLAGCVDETPVLPEAVLGDLPELVSPVIPPDVRDVLREVTWNEHREGMHPFTAFSDGNAPPPPEDRAAVLTFHGVDLVNDEWGREVPGLVYRYPVLQYQGDYEFVDLELVDRGGEWVEVQVEFLFDAADGRYLGAVWMDYGIRMFTNPAYRDPLAGEPVLLFLAVQAIEGDFTRAIPYGDGRITFTPYAMEGPVKADCEPYKIQYEDDEPEPPVDPEDAAGHGYVACFAQGAYMPSWIIRDSEEYTESYVPVAGDDMAPAFSGEALPPHVYPQEAWTEVEAPLPVIDEVLPPVYVPPVKQAGDWSDAMAQRTKALMLDLDFTQYRLEHDELSLRDGTISFPYIDLVGFLLQDVAPENPGLPDETSWLMFTDGQGSYWGFVDTHRGDESEEPDRHTPGRRGSNRDFGAREYPTRDDLPTTVAPLDVARQVPHLVPASADQTSFMMWPVFFEGFIEADWFAMQHCWEDLGDTPNLVVSLDATDGHLTSAGYGYSHEQGCGWGSNSASSGLMLEQSWDGQQSTWLIDGHIVRFHAGQAFVGPQVVPSLL